MLIFKKPEHDPVGILNKKYIESLDQYEYVDEQYTPKKPKKTQG